ncbi:MAG: hypothetical protein GXO77_06085 [Calditrichaeota bacterium]|nr:hypothetical protein [Calditrichota bacterium]
MKTSIYFSLMFFLLTGIGFAQNTQTDSLNSEIQLRTYLEKEPVPLNDEVVYQVELSWVGKLNRYRILEISNPVLTNLKLRGSGSSNRFYLDDNNQPHSLKKITFYFTPLEMGMAYIDGITIKYQDAVLNQTGQLMSQRIGVKITEPTSRPGEGMRWGKMLVIFLAILFIFTVIYSIIRYFQQKKKQEIQEEPQQTVEEEFLQTVKQNIRADNGIPEKKFNELMDITKQYLRKRFDLPAGAEFFEIKIVLEKASVPQQVLSKLEQFYQRAELVKFAGEPVNETELHFFIDTVELLLQEMNKRNNLNR